MVVPTNYSCCLRLWSSFNWHTKTIYWSCCSTITSLEVCPQERRETPHGVPCGSSMGDDDRGESGTHETRALPLLPTWNHPTTNADAGDPQSGPLYGQYSHPTKTARAGAGRCGSENECRVRLRMRRWAGDRGSDGVSMSDWKNVLFNFYCCFSPVSLVGPFTSPPSGSATGPSDKSSSWSCSPFATLLAFRRPAMSQSRTAPTHASSLWGALEERPSFLYIDFASSQFQTSLTIVAVSNSPSMRPVIPFAGSTSAPPLPSPWRSCLRFGCDVD